MTSWNQLSGTRQPLTSMVLFHKNNGTKEFLAVSNKQLYKDSNGTLTAITGALATNSIKTLAYKNRSIQDVLLLADKGKLKVYNSTSVSEVIPHTPTVEEQTDPGLNDLVNLTNFRAMAIKKDRAFAAAHPTVKNRISFCHHDPKLGYAVYDYWPATFFFDVATEDNDEIVELKVFRDGLIILCKRSIWVLYGDGRTLADYQLHKINVPSGCIAPDYVQLVGNNLFYLSDNHVYSLFSTDQNYISAEIVSTNVENTLKSIPRTDKEKAVATFFDNKYFLSFPSGLCLVFDVLLGAWVKWTNIQANAFLTQNEVLYFSSNDGSIYSFNEALYTDNGDIIPFRMKTKIMDFSYTVQTKKIRRMWVIAKQFDGYLSTFNVKGMMDGYAMVDLIGDSPEVDANHSLVWDESQWDDVVWDFAEITQQELRLRKKGKTLQLDISNEKANEPVTIYGLVFEYKVKKP